MMHFSHSATAILGLVNKLLSVSAAGYHSNEGLGRNVKPKMIVLSGLVL